MKRVIFISIVFTILFASSICLWLDTNDADHTVKTTKECLLALSIFVNFFGSLLFLIFGIRYTLDCDRQFPKHHKINKVATYYTLPLFLMSWIYVFSMLCK